LTQSREDEGTPTSQNTIHNTAGFTPPSQNPPQTTHSPKNRPSTQPLEHHSPQHRSPQHDHSPKSPPHTTPPQNLPTEQASQHRSPPHVHSPKSPHMTPPLQNPSTEHNKAPGPDGFPTEFYQVFWDLIKSDLMALFREFHRGNLPLYILNLRTIILLPKCVEALTIQQNRPICFLNVSFKIIMKVITNRLMGVAHRVIQPTQ
jgi:hypothetical protein